MRKLLIIITTLIFSIITVNASWWSSSIWDWSWCGTSDSNQICSNYINEYNIEVCSCNEKALAIPMTIFGEVKWNDLEIWIGAEIFIYNSVWDLLNKNIVKENWKYWTNDGFKIDERININYFEWEPVVKIKYWNYLYNDVNIQRADWYNCNEKFVFQNNKLCKYEFEVYDTNKISLWWGWRSSSRNNVTNLQESYSSITNWNIEVFTKESKKISLKNIKFQQKYNLIDKKLEQILIKFKKKNEEDTLILKNKLSEWIKEYLYYLESWNKWEAIKVLWKLRVIMKDFSKELKKEIVIKKHISQNLKIKKIEERIDVLIKKSWQEKSNEIIELRNIIIKDIENYLSNINDEALKKELIKNLKLLLSKIK